MIPRTPRLSISSIASVTAIHFGIHGPVETLTFPHKPVEAGIAQAQRLLAAGRADRVIVVWAEQAASIAQDLCRRAVERLGRREFGVFVEELGSGAVALVLGAGDTILKVPEDDRHVKGKPFMMKRAVVLAADIVQGRADKGVGTAT